MATAVAATPTNNPEIDGLLGGARWSGTITYSFPDSPSDYPASYYGNNEPNVSGFSAAPVAIQQAITYAVGLIASYTNATFQFAGTNGADIAIAQSPAANPTAYAYYPYNVPAGGDIWFGNSYNYSQAQLGNYFFVTALHELGHAIGLKHSQEAGGVSNVAVPAAHDHSEYTVMSYRSYAGAPLTGYTAEAFGYAQTYMANDILALQTLYGADFTTRSENTVYTWSSTTGQQFINGVAQLAPGTGAGGSSNRVFETVWDGDGIDTYDFSNYATALRVNLNPGASSTTSATQIANLGNGYYASGNVYNAYLFNGDARSYIDNALGGSGNDSITGNAIANNLSGGGGNDTLTGAGGNDTVSGGSGTDTVVFSGNRANYLVSYNAGTQTFTVADQRGGTPDGIDTVTGVESFQFANGVYASSALATPNSAPVLTVPSANVSAVAGQTFAASSLFSATDADGAVHGYYLYDANATANSGRFVVNGTVVPSQTVYWINAAQLAQTSFVAGASGTSDELRVIAYDGQTYSNNSVFTYLNVNVAANSAPVLTVPSANVSAVAGQTFAASSLFSATDADGAVQGYYLYDANATANSGRFVVNGTVVPSQTVYWINAAQLAQTSFVAGASGTSDELRVIAYDGQTYSNNSVFTYLNVNVAANSAPVLTVPSANVSAVAGQTFAASSLFSATDADGAVQGYYLYDANATANSGRFVVNGTVVPSQTVYWINAAQLAQTSFVAGASGTSDELRVIAYDGQTYSNNSTFTYFNVNVAPNQAPVLTVSSPNVAAAAGQTLSASSLFGATDADGAVQGYYLYDANPAANSGHFVVNGTVVPSQFVSWISAAQLAQTSFVAGTGGTSDELRVIAYDGQTYSNNSVFTYFHVSAAASPAAPVAGSAPTGGADNFAFLPGLGQEALMHLSQGAADKYLPLADYFKQMLGTAVVASTEVTPDGGHGEAAVDLLALFGLHAADQAHFVF